MSYQIPQYKGSLKWITDGFSLSAGKKFLMAFTGLFLLSFLVIHLIGNLLLLKNDGGIAFNEYSESMAHSKIIKVIEVFMFAGFIFHIIFGFLVSWQNKRARGKSYSVIKANVTSSFFSRHMIQSGLLVLLFLLIHLNTFFVEHKIIGTSETMFESVVRAFQNIYYTIFYIIIMLLLAFHLAHGFQSAFQSLGINHNKYTPLIKITGKFYAVVVPALFAIIPVVVYLKY